MIQNGESYEDSAVFHSTQFSALLEYKQHKIWLLCFPSYLLWRLGKLPQISHREILIILNVSYFRKSRCRKKALAPLRLQKARKLPPMGKIPPAPGGREIRTIREGESRAEEVRIHRPCYFYAFTAPGQILFRILSN